MVGSRHLFYGLSMLHKYHGTGRKKFYLIYTTSDETFAVNYTAKIPAHVDKGWFYFWVSFLDQIYWVFGAFMGSVIGGLIPFETKGLDFVMTAMFLTIFIGQWVSDSKSGNRTNSRESNESHSKHQPSVIPNYLLKHLPEIIGVIGSLLSLVVAATVTTRFLPYILFPEGKKVPSIITYLGKVLGPAVFGLLVIYCFRNISISGGQHGIPELIATIAIHFLYHWKENMILPIAGGTILYMVLLHLSSV